MSVLVPACQCQGWREALDERRLLAKVHVTPPLGSPLPDTLCWLVVPLVLALVVAPVMVALVVLVALVVME